MYNNIYIYNPHFNTKEVLGHQAGSVIIWEKDVMNRIDLKVKVDGHLKPQKYPFFSGRSIEMCVWAWKHLFNALKIPVPIVWYEFKTFLHYDHCSYLVDHEPNSNFNSQKYFFMKITCKFLWSSSTRFFHYIYTRKVVVHFGFKMVF